MLKSDTKKTLDFEALYRVHLIIPTLMGYIGTILTDSSGHLTSLFGTKNTWLPPAWQAGTRIYRVSQKKLGLVFRGHFRPLNGRKSKKGRNGLWTCLIFDSMQLPSKHLHYIPLTSMIYMVYCIYGWKPLLVGKIEF